MLGRTLIAAVMAKTESLKRICRRDIWAEHLAHPGVYCEFEPVPYRGLVRSHPVSTHQASPWTISFVRLGKFGSRAFYTPTLRPARLTIY